MKILIVTGIFPPDIGGPASYVPKIAKELIKRGHAVSVICLSDALENRGEKYDYDVYRIRRSTSKPVRWMKTIFKIKKEARIADIVYINGLSLEATIALFLTGIPSVHKIVGDYSWERARNRGWFIGTIDEYQKARKPFLLKLTDWVRTYPLKKAYKVIVPSNYLKAIVTGWGIPAERVSTVYNSIKTDSQFKTPELPDFGGKNIITVCRLVPWKGLKELIAVVKNIQDMRLIICGDGPLRGELEAVAERLNMSNRVYFVGQVEGESVSGYLKQADCFVLNSSYEGLPHVVLEAMAAGIPVVATDVGGTGEVVINHETGLLVPSGDNYSLEKAILSVVENGYLAGKLVLNANLMLSERFSYENMVNRTHEILVEAAEIRNKWKR